MRQRAALLALIAWLAPVEARATPPIVCTNAYDQAQVLQKVGKLVDARDQLRLCAQPSCPALVVSDCTLWLEEAQSSVPSVIPLATDETGANVLDARVWLDGTPLEIKAAGQAIDVNPGLRHFTFERPGAVPVVADVLVAVGEKNKRVVVVIRKGTPDAATTPHAAESLPTTRASTSGGSKSVLGVVGLGVGAAGVVGLGVGAVFGAETITNQSDAHCPRNVCAAGSNPGALRNAAADGNLSTAFFIAGGVLTAAGVTTWLLAPSRQAGSTAWVRPAPVAVANGAGLVVTGGW